MNAKAVNETIRTMTRCFWNHTDACRQAWLVVTTIEDMKRLARCAGDCIDAEKKERTK